MVEAFRLVAVSVALVGPGFGGAAALFGASSAGELVGLPVEKVIHPDYVETKRAHSRLGPELSGVGMQHPDA